MSWAKVDDRANEHPKLLEVGAKAAWLWVCGLMYCNRQPKKTGRIPKTVVDAGMLYPGLGKGEAKKLTQAGLWHDVGSEYEVHQHSSWNPELSKTRSDAGRVGGLKSAETRREAKEQATEEANQEANGQANLKQVASENEANGQATGEASAGLAHSRARTHAQTRAGSTPPHPTPDQPDTTTQGPDRPPALAVVSGGGGDSQGKIPCPKDLVLTTDQRGTLLGTALIPDWAIDVLTARFVANQQAGDSQDRPLSAWRKCLSQAISGWWNNPQHRPRRQVNGPDADVITVDS